MLVLTAIRDAPIRQWPIIGRRRLTIGRLSADYRLIHKPDILTYTKDCINHKNILLYNATD